MDDRLKYSTPIMPPIYQASTYYVKSMDTFEELINKDGYFYLRHGCPTSRVAEDAIKELEGGVGTCAFSSGMAAVSTIFMAFLKPGDHMVMNYPVYSGVDNFIRKFLVPKMQIEITRVPAGCDVEMYRKHVKENTKILYGETPCNPILTILDLDAFGKLGQSLPGVITVVDSTFGGPYVQQPIKHGVDICFNSCTKYLGGHSDLLGGCATTRTKELYDVIQDMSITAGNRLNPFDASLLYRGVLTLGVRMEKHSQNALGLAKFLENHPIVNQVWYPGLPSHPQHDTAKKQMKVYAGMIAFDMKCSLECAKSFVENLKVIKLAVSLGGVRSLIELASLMTHGPWISGEECVAMNNLPETLVRLSVGIEDMDVLMEDLKQALDKIPVAS
ncbi:uncharacterized protein LOC106173993 isoform X1 [Lingula anatina]|uniref:plant cystathionine gamma-synthase n=2 Tax=Lingula anatina TaxID=7574 RepID=A0A1S3JKA5_LINAN|nr:uncharacterized protein LOC106173993 isoform X1 [Lingula anatina]|eukprot:XP_013410807.1 uncharacterized protein LOC106173993 isoform X1 [Lingula anatina]